MTPFRGSVRAGWSLGIVVLACVWLSALGRAQAPAAPQGGARPQERPPGESPATPPRPPTVTPQTYPAEQIEAGRPMFASRCGFCHGRDAQGGESGPDLTRSTLVAEDVHGDQLGPMLRAGRADKGMPAFTLSDSELAAMVAFIHDAKAKAEAIGGGRRTVDVEDLQTGNADAGRRYFNGAGGCVKCHSLDSDFATVASRYEGWALLPRMLYPGSGRGTQAPPTPPTLTVTTRTGQTVTGKLDYRDEFTISLIDADGWTRSWSTDAVKISGDEPLSAHIAQLPKYTDGDMHDVFAYLQTLR
jgi:cytochrome c oxidase cbb3-type subunit 3